MSRLADVVDLRHCAATLDFFGGRRCLNGARAGFGAAKTAIQHRVVPRERTVFGRPLGSVSPCCDVRGLHCHRRYTATSPGCNVGIVAAGRARGCLAKRCHAQWCDERRCQGELELHSGVIHRRSARCFVLAVAPARVSSKSVRPLRRAHAPGRRGRTLRSPVFIGLCTYYVSWRTPLPRGERMRVAARLPLRGRRRSRDAFVTQWAYYRQQLLSVTNQRRA
jgi:hypothetical protein